LHYDKQNKKIKIIKEIYGGTESISALALDKDKKRLISTSKEGYSKVWSLDSLEFQLSLVGHKDNVVNIICVCYLDLCSFWLYGWTEYSRHWQLGSESQHLSTR
jgi:WD40 repeat protein